MTTAHGISFAEYIGYEIDNSYLSQEEISKKMGLNSSNLICMYKKGKSKIPLWRVPVLSKILNLDPGKMLRMALREYEPETADVLEKYMGSIVSSSESMLLSYIKNKLGTEDIPKSLTKHQLEKLDEFIDSLGKKL